MTVESRLKQAFNAYLNLAKAELRPQQTEPTGAYPFQLIKDKSVELRYTVERIEGSSEFHEMISKRQPSSYARTILALILLMRFVHLKLGTSFAALAAADSPQPSSWFEITN